MNEFPFQYAVLRYVHDPMTREFINIGIVVYSREARYIKACITQRYLRLSCAFQQEVNGVYYHRVTSYLLHRFERLHRDLQKNDMFNDPPEKLEVLLTSVLPPTDSSLVFGGYGGGIVHDLDAELSRLHARLVERYMEKPERGRLDQDVWQIYRKELAERNVIQHLASVTIEVPTYSYDFEHAWRNERWHPVEPVSFDMVYRKSILDKANKWIGRSALLAKSDMIGTLYLLLGSPTDPQPEIEDAYENAKRNLESSLQLPHRIIEESNASAFSEEFSEMIDAHLPRTSE